MGDIDRLCRGLIESGRWHEATHCALPMTSLIAGSHACLLLPRGLKSHIGRSGRPECPYGLFERGHAGDVILDAGEAQGIGQERTLRDDQAERL